MLPIDETRVEVLEESVKELRGRVKAIEGNSMTDEPFQSVPMPEVGETKGESPLVAVFAIVDQMKTLVEGKMRELENRVKEIEDRFPQPSSSVFDGAIPAQTPTISLADLHGVDPMPMRVELATKTDAEIHL